METAKENVAQTITMRNLRKFPAIRDFAVLKLKAPANAFPFKKARRVDFHRSQETMNWALPNRKKWNGRNACQFWQGPTYSPYRRQWSLFAHTNQNLQWNWLQVRHYVVHFSARSYHESGQKCKTHFMQEDVVGMLVGHGCPT